MIVAMSFGALIAFVQIVLALLLLYACGYLFYHLRGSHPAPSTRPQQKRAILPQRDLR
jgi:flagellar basal body-associated protein FliL